MAQISSLRTNVSTALNCCVFKTNASSFVQKCTLTTTPTHTIYHILYTLDLLMASVCVGHNYNLTQFPFEVLLILLICGVTQLPRWLLPTARSPLASSTTGLKMLWQVITRNYQYLTALIESPAAAASKRHSCHTIPLLPPPISLCHFSIRSPHMAGRQKMAMGRCAGKGRRL